MLTRQLAALTLIGLIAGSVPAQEAKKPEKKPLEVKKAPPPYAVDHAKALEAKEAVESEADDHTRYRVEFKGIKDDMVPAYLYLPKRKADAPPCPAVLLQYGSGGNKKTDYIVAIGKQFVARGFIVLTIDSPNQGERRSKENKTGILGLLGADQVMHYCGDYGRAV